MRILATAMFMLAPLLASAEALPDPTRPAPGMEVGAGAVASGVASGPRLQMIKISPARRSAIIDGQEVTLGSRVGEMRVVKISEGEVVLKGKSETETLKLFSDVEKRPVAAQGATAKTARPAKKKSDAGASRKAKE
jgi:MSHA biogenesis protein MshK